MEGTKELFELASKALPGAWEAMIRQVYIYGISSIIIAVISGTIAVMLFFKIFNSNPSNEAESSNPDGEGIMFCGMIITVVMCLVLLVMGVMYLINPEYHAIQMLKP